MRAAPFVPPAWAAHLKHVPKTRLALMQENPTPVQPWTFSAGPGSSFSLLIKRDDLTEAAASGNKIRKLEFLLAEAQEHGADALISIGGTASNHCRAVAALAGRAGWDKCYLVLRKDRYHEGHVRGNLLLNNVLGAHTFLVELETYAKKGQRQLTAELAERVVAQGLCKNPFVIPVGGSVTTGVWGYICMMQELAAQLGDAPADVIFFATGSGGTAAGLAVARALCPAFAATRVVGYAVCDSPEYFYQHVEHEFAQLGLPPESVRGLIEFRDAKNAGYAVSTPAETELIRRVARSSGILLDGAYTGKAVFGFVRDAEEFAGKRCLFVHTGGAFSLFGMPPGVIVDPSLVSDF